MDMKFDAEEKLIWNSDSAAVVLGGPDGSIALLELGCDRCMSDMPVYQQRGFFYAGVVGVRDGVFETAIATHTPISYRAMSFAVPAYSKVLCEKPHAPTGDSANWLEKLFTLRDPRAAEN